MYRALGLVGLLSVASPARGATLVVSSTADSGDGTLRAALIASDDTPEQDTITFDITGDGPHVILLTSALPAAGEGGVVIDGFTQSGSSPATDDTPADLQIILTAMNVEDNPFGPALPAAPVLYLTDDSVLRGVMILGGPGAGVFFEGSSLAVEGVSIGTTPDGASAVPLAGCGVQVGSTLAGLDAGSVTLGGDTSAYRILIAGNGLPGVCVETADDVTIRNALIGVREDRITTLPNAGGIDVGGTVGTLSVEAGTHVVGDETRGTLRVNGAQTVTVSDALLNVRPDGTVLDGDASPLRLEAGTVTVERTALGGTSVEVLTTGDVLFAENDFHGTGLDPIFSLDADGSLVARDNFIADPVFVEAEAAGDVTFDDNIVEGAGGIGIASGDGAVAAAGNDLGSLEGLDLYAEGDLDLQDNIGTVELGMEIQGFGVVTVTGNDFEALYEGPELGLSAGFGLEMGNNRFALLELEVALEVPLDATVSGNTFEEAAFEAEVSGALAFSGNTGSLGALYLAAAAADLQDNTLLTGLDAVVSVTGLLHGSGNDFTADPFGDGFHYTAVPGAITLDGDVQAGDSSWLESDGPISITGGGFDRLFATSETSVLLSGVAVEGQLAPASAVVTLQDVTCGTACTLGVDASDALVVDGSTFGSLGTFANEKVTLSCDTGPVTVTGSTFGGPASLALEAATTLSVTGTDFTGADDVSLVGGDDLLIDTSSFDALTGALFLEAGDDLSMTGSTVGSLGDTWTDSGLALVVFAEADFELTGNTFDGSGGPLGISASGAGVFSDNVVTDLDSGEGVPALVVQAPEGLVAEGNDVSGIYGLEWSSTDGDATIRGNTIDAPGSLLVLNARAGTLEISSNTLVAGNTLEDEEMFAVDGGTLVFEDNTWVLTGTIRVRSAGHLTFDDNDVDTVAAGSGALAVQGGVEEGLSGHLAGNTFDGLSGFGCGAWDLTFENNQVTLQGTERTFGMGGNTARVEGNTFSNANGYSGMGAGSIQVLGNTFVDVTAFDQIGGDTVEVVGNTFTRMGAPVPEPLPPETEPGPLDVRATTIHGEDWTRFEGNSVVDALHPFRLVGDTVEAIDNTLVGGRGLAAFAVASATVTGNQVLDQVDGYPLGELTPALSVVPYRPTNDDPDPLTDCLVSTNHVEGNAATGLYTQCRGESEISDNTTIANDVAGLFATGSSIVLAGNVLQDNRGIGGAVFAETALEVAENQATGNHSYGLVVQTSLAVPPEIVGNTTQDNGGSGLLIVGRAALSDNLFGHNGGLGVDFFTSGGQLDIIGGVALVSPNDPSENPPCLALARGFVSELAPTAWPTVDDVRWDTQDRLVVTGRACPGSLVDVYRSAPDDDEPTLDGRTHGEGVALLGTVTAGAVDGAFALTVDDVAFTLEGPSQVTAMAWVEETGSSEFGPNLPVPSCGDGGLDPYEVCDDGNNDAGDGCSPTCTAEHGFQCTAGPSHGCTATCGDGVLATGVEACDDDNVLDGDGCSATCTIEIGFACDVDESADPESACAAVCGDFQVLGEETCDDGNTVGGDGCSAECRRQPVTSILTGPGDPTSALTATFTYTDANHVAVTFECSQDEGASWVPCDRATETDGVYTYTWTDALASGTTHVFLVRGVADDGTLDETPASWSWQIEIDPDDDGINAELDNCLEVANPDQADLDRDGEGDACDEDIDGDGLRNDQEDVNGDGVLDGRETDPLLVDTDGDGLCDGWSDQPILDAGGDVLCTLGEDVDLDGVTSADETDPTVADSDGDCVDDGEEVLELESDPLDPDDPERDGACEVEETGCGCATGPQPGLLLWLLPLGLLWVRRRPTSIAVIALAVAATFASPRAATAATFTVDDPGDDPDAAGGDATCETAKGTCTLRAALAASDDTPGQDAIHFAIPGTGPHLIEPASALPAAGEGGVVIDGYTQPGSAPETASTAPVIAIVIGGGDIEDNPWEGELAAAPLLYLGGDSEVRGLVVGEGPGAGVLFRGDSLVVEGSAIGALVSGTYALPNGGCGIQIGRKGGDPVGTARIGGTTPAARVLVAGNDGAGICVYAGDDVEIAGTRIGVRRDGITTLHNQGGGVTGFGAEDPDGIEDWTVGTLSIGPDTWIAAPGEAPLVSISGVVDAVEVTDVRLGTRADGTALPPGTSTLDLAIEGTVDIADTAVAAAAFAVEAEGAVTLTRSDLLGSPGALVSLAGLTTGVTDTSFSGLGIAVQGAAGLQFSANTLAASGAEVELANSSGAVTVEDNEVSGATRFVAYTEQGTFLASGNTLTVAGDLEMGVEFGTATIEDNTVRGVAFLETFGGLGLSCSGNDFSAEALSVFSVLDTASFSGNTLDLGELEIEGGPVLLSGNTGWVGALDLEVPSLDLLGNTLAGEVVEGFVSGPATLEGNDLDYPGGVGIAGPRGSIRITGDTHGRGETYLETDGPLRVDGGTYGTLSAEGSSVEILGATLGSLGAGEGPVVVRNVTCAGACNVEIDSESGMTEITGSTFAGGEVVVFARSLLLQDVAVSGDDAIFWGERDLTVRSLSLEGCDEAALESSGDLVVETSDFRQIGEGLEIETEGDAWVRDNVFADVGTDDSEWELWAEGDFVFTGNVVTGGRGEVEMGGEGTTLVSDNQISLLPGSEGNEDAGSIDLEGGIDLTLEDNVLEIPTAFWVEAAVVSMQGNVLTGFPQLWIEAWERLDSTGNDLDIGSVGDETEIDAGELSMAADTVTARGAVSFEIDGAAAVADSTFWTDGLLAFLGPQSTFERNQISGGSLVLGGGAVEMTDNVVDLSIPVEAELPFGAPNALWIGEALSADLRGNVIRNALGPSEIQVAGDIVLIGNLVQDVSWDDSGVACGGDLTMEQNTFTRLLGVGAGGDFLGLDMPFAGFISEGDASVRDNHFDDAVAIVGVVALGAGEFTDNVVTGGQGTVVMAESMVTVASNEIVGNHSEHLLGAIVPLSLIVVGASFPAGLPSERCVVRDNLVSDNESGGIGVICIEGLSMTDNVVTGNEFWAVLAMAGILDFSDNVVEDNIGSGTLAMGIAGINYARNQVSRNGGLGAMIMGDNSVLGLLPIGLPIEPVEGEESGAGVHDNVFRDNGAAGIVAVGPVDVHGNQFGGNDGLALSQALLEVTLSFAGIAGVTPNAPDEYPACTALAPNLITGDFLGGMAWPTIDRYAWDAQDRLVLHGTACPGSRVEIYHAAADPSEPALGGVPHGEGIEALGTAMAGDDGTFTFVVPDTAFTREGPAWVSGLAYLPEVGTSEFGPNLPIPSCGDGVLDRLDACDDGNNEAGDGCSPTCTVEHGWDCPTGVDRTCTSTCGDGLLAAGVEDCDDDNRLDGDGCSAACTVEEGFDCATGEGQPCTAECGDFRVLGEETCDDGNTAAGDGCSDICRREPTMVVLTGPADPSGAPTADFTFTDSNGVATSYECAEDGGAWVPCNQRAPDPGVYRYTWSGTLANDHTYVFAVRGAAADGTEDPTPATWTWTLEDDADGDGLDYLSDNCPDVSNPDQADLDRDGTGDACDEDADGDGIVNALEDLDGDGVLDKRETDALYPDTDGDGLCDGWVDAPVLDDEGAVLCAAGEDVNLNGVTDEGETDPLEPDSDGDCLLDGEEYTQLASDPLDPDDPEPGGTCPEEEVPQGCGCATGPAPSLPLLFLPLLLIRRRRSDR